MDKKEIADVVGGVIALSKKLGLSRATVSQWTAVPSKHVLAVCALTGWRATPHYLRPDLYPNPGDALPADFLIPHQPTPAESDCALGEPRDDDHRVA